MILLLVIMILSSLWGIIIIDEFTLFRQFLNWIGMGYERKWGSEYPVLDLFFFIIWKVCNCSMCFSAWLCAFTLLACGTWIGFFIMPVSYFLTFFIKKYMTTSI